MDGCCTHMGGWDHSGLALTHDIAKWLDITGCDSGCWVHLANLATSISFKLVPSFRRCEILFFSSVCSEGLEWH